MGTTQCPRIWIILFLLLVAVTANLASVCYKLRGETGCKYDCHCRGNARCAQNTGACPSGCANGLFGPACQYANADLKLPEESGEQRWVTDDDERTCNAMDSGTTTVTVELNPPQRLTWIRLVFRTSEKANGEIYLGYKTNEASQIGQCTGQQSSLVGPKSLDIFCPTTDLVTLVQLTGLGTKNLCSLYVSAGRNVALKQDAFQSTTFYSWNAGQAVDGFRERDVKNTPDTCSHTQSRSNGFWSLSFRKPADILRVVLYNRINYYFRLKGFTFLMQDKEKETLYTYKDKEDKGHSTYTIIPLPRRADDVYSLKVIQGADSRFVTLCEVIAYGETVCPAGRYGRECENLCNCFNQSSCFVHSGGCPLGCSHGFYGDDCRTECREGSYGFGCNEVCGDHCKGEKGTCNHIDGACEDGCEVGYLPPLCADECPIGKFGQDCKQNCSVHCKGEGYPCNPKDGSCDLGCEPGYLPPVCVNECGIGKYGLDCKENCSAHCKGEDKHCYPSNGECKLGCEIGYSPPQCVEECPASSYGESCADSCNARCMNNTCHHKSGRCHACQTGYRGYYCDLECRSRTYGDECAKTCDANCLNLLCDHVTGKCDQCVDGKEGQFCQKVAAKKNNSQPVFIGTALGVVLGLIIIVTILAIYMFRNRIFKRKQSAASSKTTTSRDSGLELCSVEASSGLQNSTGHRPSKGQVHTIAEEDSNADNMYMNVGTQSTAVSVEELKSYIQLHANDHFLKDQFESIPTASKYSRLNAHDPTNAKKNRYKNILPDDYTRVCLKVYDEYEDYINASHIKNYYDKRAFIAAQAPNNNTLDDFVRMLWEQEVDRIVMLTNLVEGKKIKSSQYWNNDEPTTFDTITVTLNSTEVFAEYTVRHLTLSKNGSSTRDLTQFHFIAWPDKSVPDSPWGLVELYQRIMTDPGTGPLLVHCSAGVGRTGTFIGLCILMQEAEATGNMDFLHTLWKMRQARMFMIQTAGQYEFLHRLALTAYLVSGTSFPVENITDKLQTLEETDPYSHNSGYNMEFQAVCKACFHEIEDSDMGDEESDNVYQNNRVAATKSKNRVKNILPNDSYRPVLACENKSLGKYINAVLVPDVTNSRQDILTQLPLPSTVIDFWRLVTQYNVGLVVAFETNSWKSDETVGKFFPDTETEPIRTDLFEIQAKLAAECSGCHEVLVTVFKKRKSIMGGVGEHRVTCLLCKTPDTDPKTALDIHKKIKYWKPDSPLRTLFMCRNGADYCGLMCVQSILLDRMETDQRVSVPLVVGTVKAIRPQVIPTVDQYIYLYDVLKRAQDNRSVEEKLSIVDMIDSSETTYCNVKSQSSATKAEPQDLSDKEDAPSEGEKEQNPPYLDRDILPVISENLAELTQHTQHAQESMNYEENSPPLSPLYNNQDNYYKSKSIATETCAEAAYETPHVQENRPPPSPLYKNQDNYYDSKSIDIGNIAGAEHETPHVQQNGPPLSPLYKNQESYYE